MLFSLAVIPFGALEFIRPRYRVSGNIYTVFIFLEFISALHDIFFAAERVWVEIILLYITLS